MKRLLSGLAKMIETVGPDFNLVEDLREEHTTPFDATQSFRYAMFRHIPKAI